MPLRDAVRHVGGEPDRLARDHDQPGIERVDVDPDRIEALVHGEGDGLTVILEWAPRAARAGLEADPAEDEGAMVGILELVVGIDPARDPDVGSAPGGSDRVGLCHGDHGRGREQAPDPVRRPERAQDETAGDESDEARSAEEKGTHGPDDSRTSGPALPAIIGPYRCPARGGHGKTRRNLLAAWALR